VSIVQADRYKPQLRAGIHLGKPRKLGGDYLGVDVNIAARVASGAKPGEILVSSAACEKLDDAKYTMKRKRRFKAKGAPKELEVFAVVDGGLVL
jgi:class 3 adenylate cyclase